MNSAGTSPLHQAIVPEKKIATDNSCNNDQGFFKDAANYNDDEKRYNLAQLLNDELKEE